MPAVLASCIRRKGLLNKLRQYGDNVTLIQESSYNNAQGIV